MTNVEIKRANKKEANAKSARATREGYTRLEDMQAYKDYMKLPQEERDAIRRENLEMLASYVSNRC